ncbi:hypothetical protein LB450_13315 [Psychroflexus sp. CAK1W]|uniref:hypothetical protein n=1 Tax=Psychroflexus curvus TaxID=2873595 RepID=UPI001CCA13CD|nr:hypothetical protein [Psychroflexus curvus]MBZ9629082.1 hypothetical protein [Psychroflexus curvus]
MNKLYSSTPIVFQNILVNIYAIKLRFTRYNRKFHKYLKLYKNGKVDNEDLFYNFLKTAAKSPYWNKKFEKYDVNLNNNLYKEITKLPILNKNEVKESIEEIININNVSDKIIYVSTGGTTGNPLNFPITLDAINRQWAVWWRYRNKNGIELGTWCGWFGGKVIVPQSQKEPPFFRKDYIGKQILFSPIHLNFKNAEHYYNTIKKEKLAWLHGYSSQLNLLASYIIELNLCPIESLKLITIGAENLTNEQKIKIETAFKVPVRQHYGLAEGVANISERPDGKLRIDEDFSYVEFIPTDDKEIYKIIGTNFTNPAFPLIRYDTGDLVKIKHEGNEFIVQEILGRSKDFVTLPNGNSFGPMNLIFKNIEYVREAQVYQPNTKKLIFRVVKIPGYDENNQEEKLLESIKERITDSQVRIKIEYFDKLPRTHSGKLKAVITDI